MFRPLVSHRELKWQLRSLGAAFEAGGGKPPITDAGNTRTLRYSMPIGALRAVPQSVRQHQKCRRHLVQPLRVLQRGGLVHAEGCDRGRAPAARPPQQTGLFPVPLPACVSFDTVLRGR